MRNTMEECQQDKYRQQSHKLMRDGQSDKHMTEQRRDTEAILLQDHPHK